MKTINRISFLTTVLMLAFTIQSSYAGNSEKIRKSDQQDFITLKGKVVDAETGDALVFATVAVSESNVAIITNIDGEFTLKVGNALISQNLEVSYLGYKNKVVPISSMRDNGYKNMISMETAPIPIKEVIVKPLDPDLIVENAIYKIGRNYESIPNLMTAFYRETIRKNRTYVSIGEAAVEVFKAPYANDIRFDAARLYKGRKSTDVARMDTVLFKLQGGISNTLDLDIVKNTELILTIDAMKSYDYSLTSVIEIDSRAEVKFKVNWKRRLFNTYYTTMSEMAITDRTDQEVIKFAGKEKLRYSDVFSEKVSDFTDPEFWGDYNVIEPDQSIESAIRRLSRKLKFSDRDDLDK
ncbi:MAG: hypothetical protein H6Q23_581 [Bacteroidetes bacterium]|nr:hypothetical protein [Bacteroidota bacterium]